VTIINPACDSIRVNAKFYDDYRGGSPLQDTTIGWLPQDSSFTLKVCVNEPTAIFFEISYYFDDPDSSICISIEGKPELFIRLDGCIPNIDTCLPISNIQTFAYYDTIKDSCCVTLILDTECDSIQYNYEV